MAIDTDAHEIETTMTAPTDRLRRLLLVAGATLVLPTALGTASACAYTATPETEAALVAAPDGTHELAPSGTIAAAPDGPPDVLMAGDLIRRLRPDPAPCTYADKSDSDGSVVRMDGGVLRECQGERWVPYLAPPKS